MLMTAVPSKDNRPPNMNASRCRPSPCSALLFFSPPFTFMCQPGCVSYELARWFRGSGVPSVLSITMAIVRATDATDPFLLSWTKDAANPIT